MDRHYETAQGTATAYRLSDALGSPWTVTAVATRDGSRKVVTVDSAYRDEAGFRGRDWRVGGTDGDRSSTVNGSDQFASLRDIAEQAIAVAARGLEVDAIRAILPVQPEAGTPVPGLPGFVFSGPLSADEAYRRGLITDRERDAINATGGTFPGPVALPSVMPEPPVMPAPRKVRSAGGSVSYFTDLPEPRQYARAFGSYGVAVAIEQWWNAEERAWVTYPVSREGYQLGTSDYSGNRADAAAALRSFWVLLMDDEAVARAWAQERGEPWPPEDRPSPAQVRAEAARSLAGGYPDPDDFAPEPCAACGYVETEDGSSRDVAHDSLCCGAPACVDPGACVTHDAPPAVVEVHTDEAEAREAFLNIREEAAEPGFDPADFDPRAIALARHYASTRGLPDPSHV